MGQAWSGHGSSPVRAWVKPGQGMGKARSGHGSDLIRTATSQHRLVRAAARQFNLAKAAVRQHSLVVRSEKDLLQASHPATLQPKGLWHYTK